MICVRYENVGILDRHTEQKRMFSRASFYKIKILVSTVEQVAMYYFPRHEQILTPYPVQSIDYKIFAVGNSAHELSVVETLLPHLLH
jgi:hypothetical protein